MSQDTGGGDEECSMKLGCLMKSFWLDGGSNDSWMKGESENLEHFEWLAQGSVMADITHVGKPRLDAGEMANNAGGNN